MLFNTHKHRFSPVPQPRGLRASTPGLPPQQLRRLATATASFLALYINMMIVLLFVNI